MYAAATKDEGNAADGRFSASRPGGFQDERRKSDLRICFLPDATGRLGCFGDDLLLTDGHHLAFRHQEVAIDDHRLDIASVPAVDQHLENIPEGRPMGLPDIYQN